MNNICILLSILFGLTAETAFTLPSGRRSSLEQREKRNFVPNRFDIVDNEIKHAIQRQVQNALRKNFVPNNPLLEANKWERSSSSRYPENQLTMMYGMEYDQINPSRSDPGYLVLDLKKLAQGQLKFHEQQLGSQKVKEKMRPKTKPKQNQQLTYSNPTDYGQYQEYYNGYYSNYQQPSTNTGMEAFASNAQSSQYPMTMQGWN